MNATTLTIGQRIRWLRKGLGMRSGELAKAVGITPASMSDIETGKTKSPSASTLLKIAAVLEANPQWLIDGKGDHKLNSAHNATTSEMMQVFSELSPVHKQAILAAAKALK